MLLAMGASGDVQLAAVAASTLSARLSGGGHTVTMQAPYCLFRVRAHPSAQSLRGRDRFAVAIGLQPYG